MSTLTLSVKNGAVARDGDVITAIAGLPATTTVNTEIGTAVAPTAVAAAIATLVADGASPTQAHVTTLNNAWTTYNTNLSSLNTDWGTYKTNLTAAVAAANASITDVDVAISFQSTLTKAQARSALLGALAALEGLAW